MTTTYRFRVTFDIAISVSHINDALVDAAHHHYANADQIAQYPETPLQIERNRHLLAALLRHPDVLHSMLARRAAESVEYIYPTDDSLEQLRTQTLDDLAIIEQVRDDLSADDYEYFHDACQEGYFYENTSYLEEAITVQQTTFQLEDKR